MDENYKDKLVECVESTRTHFTGKHCTVAGYFRHFEKEMRLRDMVPQANKLNDLLKEKISQGGVFTEGGI